VVCQKSEKGENMRKKIFLWCTAIVCTISGVFAQSVSLARVKGQDFTTGGDYYDGQYVSYACVPEEKRYIRGFYISPVITQKLYEKIMGTNPSVVKKAEAPVTNVSMVDAMDFCRKLSALDTIDSAYSTDGYSMYTYKSAFCNRHGYRLPTEEEWEMAAKLTVIKAETSGVREWTQNRWSTKTMQNVYRKDTYSRDDETSYEIAFDQKINCTVRGNGSKEKRYCQNPLSGDSDLGFRVVLSDMTEYGFPEQKAVPSNAKPDTTISGLDEYLVNLEKTKVPDSTGFIHADIVLAELFPQEYGSYPILHELEKICEKHKTVLLNLNLKDCRYQVCYTEYCSKENFGSISYFRFNNLESLIAPAGLTDISLSECENLKWVELPAGWTRNTYGCFSESVKLKYVFVPHRKTESDKESFNFYTGVKTALIFDNTADSFRSHTSDFDTPVPQWENLPGCSSEYDHGALYCGDTFNLTLTIPENQQKKQTCKVYFVDKNNRKSVLGEKSVALNKKNNKYCIKNVKTGSFCWPDYDELEIYVQIRIVFEDGTVADYYDNQILLEG
jgi:hypothetical protein